MKRHLALTLLFLFPAIALAEITDARTTEQQKQETPSEKRRRKTEALIERNLRRGLREGDPEAIQQLLDRQQPAAASAYVSTISKTNDTSLLLGNQAVVKLAARLIGLVSLNQECVLFRDGASWQIWIEGKQSYKCELMHAPQAAKSVEFVHVTINTVEREGELLKLLDGRTLKVDEFDKIDTRLLLPPKDALLLATGKLVILDEGKAVSVAIAP